MNYKVEFVYKLSLYFPTAYYFRAYFELRSKSLLVLHRRKGKLAIDRKESNKVAPEIIN